MANDGRNVATSSVTVSCKPNNRNAQYAALLKDPKFHSAFINVFPLVSSSPETAPVKEYTKGYLLYYFKSDRELTDLSLLFHKASGYDRNANDQAPAVNSFLTPLAVRKTKRFNDKLGKVLQAELKKFMRENIVVVGANQNTAPNDIVANVRGGQHLVMNNGPKPICPGDIIIWDIPDFIVEKNKTDVVVKDDYYRLIVKTTKGFKPFSIKRLLDFLTSDADILTTLQNAAAMTDDENIDSLKYFRKHLDKSVAPDDSDVTAMAIERAKVELDDLIDCSTTNKHGTALIWHDARMVMAGLYNMYTGCLTISDAGMGVILDEVLNFAFETYVDIERRKVGLATKGGGVGDGVFYVV